MISVGVRAPRRRRASRRTSGHRPGGRVRPTRSKPPDRLTYRASTRASRTLRGAFVRSMGSVRALPPSAAWTTDLRSGTPSERSCSGGGSPSSGSRSRVARRASRRPALRGARRRGDRVSSARLPERPVGLPGRHAADRRAVLSRRCAARADRGGARGRGRGRRGSDALPPPRGRTRDQLRVPSLRAPGFGDAVRRLQPTVSRALRADPFSRAYVRHILGWYAQKHPDEDFAETFAVWLTPGLDWRAEYAGWPALRKLEWMDRVMREVASLSPDVPEPTEDDLPVSSDALDGRRALRGRRRRRSRSTTRGSSTAICCACSRDRRTRRRASRRSRYLSSHEGELVTRIAYWTGESTAAVRALVRALARRARERSICASTGSKRRR